MELFNYIENNFEQIGFYVLLFCGWLATLLDTPKEDDSVQYKLVYKIVNILAQNNGRAINHDDYDSKHDNKQNKIIGNTNENNTRKENT